MTLLEIEGLWDRDSKIDYSELGAEALSISMLHNKYRKILNREMAVLKKEKQKFSEMIRIKTEYYSGRLSTEELKGLGWPQFNLKVLRADLPIYLEADSDLIAMDSKIDLQQIKVDFLIDILKIIHNRSFHLNTAMEFLKFSNGK